MPASEDLTRVLRDAVDAHVRYYASLGRAAADLLKIALGSAVSVTLPHAAEGTGPHAAEGTGPHAAEGTGPHAAEGTGPHAAEGTRSHGAEGTGQQRAGGTARVTLMLEGETGGRALGMFAVHNGLAKRVVARVVASPLVDPEGRSATIALAFDPPEVKLEPGEQALVKITARIGRTLRPGARYRGSLHVPALPGTRIPIVVVRRGVSKATRAAGGVSHRPRRGRAAARPTRP